MTPAARLSAAIEVLGDIDARRRPAADALKDWGCRAASPDRRTGPPSRASSTTRCAARRPPPGSWARATPRAVALGMLRLQRGQGVEAIAALCSGERFAPAPLTEMERDRLAPATLDGAPACIAGDCPEWIEPSLRRAFGGGLVPELQALARRAPLDIRINTLEASREEVQNALAHLGPVATPHSPYGLRLRPGEDGRGPALQAEPDFHEGLVRGPGRGLPARGAARRARSPASRCSTSAPAAAARRWRSRR